jgi:hypothetical protein
MGLQQTYDRGGSALQIIPVTLEDGKLTDTLGTVVSLNVVGDVEFKFPFSAADSSDEANEVVLVHGVTVRTPRVTKVIDKSGNEIVNAGGNAGGGGTGFGMQLNVYEQDIPFINAIIGAGNFICWAPLGDRNHDGFAWLLGRFDGELVIKRSGNNINSVPLTIVGKALELADDVEASDMITALTAAVAPITQPGVAASAPANPLNPKTVIATTSGMLVAGDVANPGLLAGTIVLKQGS